MKPFRSNQGKRLFWRLGGIALAATVLAALPADGQDPRRQEHARRIGQIEAVSKGVFIVADPRIVDPHFSRTVILMIQHDAEGSLGLIVNRPTDVPLSKLLPETKTDIALGGKLHTGGPVMQGTLTVLLRSSTAPRGLSPVFGEVYASQEARVLAEQLNTPEAERNFRLFSGYAGWHPGQLRAEIARGDWRIVKADAHLIFDSSSESIWPEAFGRVQELLVRAGAFALAS